MFDKIALLVISIILVPVVGVCKPIINSVSPKNISEGEGLLITGTKFGVKPHAAPIMWDQFEDGQNKEPLNFIQPKWKIYDTDNKGAYYSTNDKHSGKLSIVNDFTALRGRGFATNYFRFKPSNEVYVTYWWKVANIETGDDSVLKLVRINSSVAAGGGGIYNGTGSTSYGSSPPRSHTLFTIYNNGATSTKENCCKISFKKWNKWVRIESYKKLSTPGLTNGIIETSIVGTNRYYSDHEMTRARGQSFQLDTVLLGLMDGRHHGNFQLYLDDIYINNTRSRVELGNKQDFDSCTYREVQPARFWNNTSVTVNKINQGQFQDGDIAYVFLVDANGEVSNGYKVNINSPPKNAIEIPQDFQHE